jgi:hypothetical protein
MAFAKHEFNRAEVLSIDITALVEFLSRKIDEIDSCFLVLISCF